MTSQTGSLSVNKLQNKCNMEETLIHSTGVVFPPRLWEHVVMVSSVLIISQSCIFHLHWVTHPFTHSSTTTLVANSTSQYTYYMCWDVRGRKVHRINPYELPMPSHTDCGLGFTIIWPILLYSTHSIVSYFKWLLIFLLGITVIIFGTLLFALSVTVSSNILQPAFHIQIWGDEGLKKLNIMAEYISVFLTHLNITTSQIHYQTQPLKSLPSSGATTLSPNPTEWVQKGLVCYNWSVYCVSLADASRGAGRRVCWSGGGNTGLM